MASGGHGEPATSQMAGYGAHTSIIDKEVSAEIEALREQWKLLSESARQTTAGQRLGKLIMRIEKLNREIIEGRKCDLDLQRDELEKAIRCSDMQMEVHEMDRTIEDLKIQITEAGLHNPSTKTSANAETSTAALLKIINSVQYGENADTSIEQRICVLDRKMLQLRKMIDVRRLEIISLNAVLDD